MTKLDGIKFICPLSHTSTYRSTQLRWPSAEEINSSKTTTVQGDKKKHFKTSGSTRLFPLTKGNKRDISNQLVKAKCQMPIQC